MKNYAFIVMLFFSMLPFVMTAQDDIIGEISEMNDVEVTYVNGAMLKSMSNNNINVGGFNLAKITKELKSLHILTAKKGALNKTRNKMKAVRKNKKLEVLMNMKDGSSRTELYGVVTSNGNYSKLVLYVDESKQITIVYMKGNIGQTCFDELSKSRKVIRETKTPTDKKVRVFELNLSDWYTQDNLEAVLRSGESGNLWNEGLAQLDKDLETLEEELSQYDNNVKVQLTDYEKKVAELNKKVAQLNERIASIKDNVKLGELYAERNKVYSERDNLYAERNKIYEKRNKLIEKKAKIIEKRSRLLSKKRVVRKPKKNGWAKTQSMTGDCVDNAWISRVEQTGKFMGYRLCFISVNGSNGELWSASARIDELRAIINNKKKAHEDVSEVEKLLEMWESLYDCISDKIVADANKGTTKGSKSKKRCIIYVFDRDGNYQYDITNSMADLWYNVEASFGSFEKVKEYLKQRAPHIFPRYVLKCDDNRYRLYYSSGSYERVKISYGDAPWLYFYGDEK